MKKISFIVLPFFLLVASLVSATDSKDVAGCKGVAVKAAVVFAKNQYSKKINYLIGSVTEVQGRNQNMITNYDLGLERCDQQGCGDLSYDVVVKGQSPNCKVLKVELTGEE